MCGIVVAGILDVRGRSSWYACVKENGFLTSMTAIWARGRAGAFLPRGGGEGKEEAGVVGTELAELLAYVQEYGGDGQVVS